MTRTKVVIVEGPDGTGKTTWAKWLAADRGWDYIPPLGPTPPQRLLAHTCGVLSPGEKSRVVDRLVLSELVYSRFWGRPHALIDFGQLIGEAQRRGVEISVVLFLRQPPKLSPQDLHLAPRWGELLDLYVSVGIPYLVEMRVPFTTVSNWEERVWWF